MIPLYKGAEYPIDPKQKAKYYIIKSENEPDNKIDKLTDIAELITAGIVYLGGLIIFLILVIKLIIYLLTL